MGEERRAQAVRERAGAFAPVRLERWHLDGGGDTIDDEIEDLLLAADVRVDRHRRDTQLAGETAHGEGVEALAIDDRDGASHDRLGCCSLAAPADPQWALRLSSGSPPSGLCRTARLRRRPPGQSAAHVLVRHLFGVVPSGLLTPYTVRRNVVSVKAYDVLTRGVHESNGREYRGGPRTGDYSLAGLAVCPTQWTDRRSPAPRPDRHRHVGASEADESRSTLGRIHVKWRI